MLESLFNKVPTLLKKDSTYILKIFNNTYFEQHLHTAASNESNSDYPNLGCFKKPFHANHSLKTLLTKSFSLKRFAKLQSTIIVSLAA